MTIIDERAVAGDGHRELEAQVAHGLLGVGDVAKDVVVPGRLHSKGS